MTRQQPIDRGRTGRRQLAYLAVIAANCAAAMQVGKVPGVVPLIRAEFDLTLVQVGWIVSSSSVVAATTAFMIPSVIRVVGPRWLVNLGLACLVSGSFSGALSHDVSALMASRLLESIGILCVAVGGPALLVTMASARTGETLMGFWPAAMPIGTATAMFATPVLAQSAAGWRALWWASGGAALLVLIVLLVVTRGLVPVAESRRGALALLLAAPKQLGTPVIRCLCMTATCYALLFLGVLGLLPVWFVGRGHFSLTLAIVVTGLAFLANGLVTIVAGVLQHRGSPAWLLIVFGGVVFVPCLWLIYTVSLPLGIAGTVACVFSGCGGLIASVNMRAIARHARSPAEASAGVAMVMQFTNLGQLLGPPVVGALVGSAASWLIGSVLMLPTLMIVIGGLWLRSLDRTRLTIISIPGPVGDRY